MNWIERRAKRESNLKEGAPKIWDEVKTALADACKSYNDIYAKSGNRVDFESTDQRFTAHKTVRRVISDTAHRDEPTTIFVSPVRNPDMGIKVEGAGPVSSNGFAIRADEQSAFIGASDRRIEADELSQKILEPLLFPKGEYVEAQRIGIEY